MNRTERAALVGGLVAVALVGTIPAISAAAGPAPTEPAAEAVTTAVPTTDSPPNAAMHRSACEPTRRRRRPRNDLDDLDDLDNVDNHRRRDDLDHRADSDNSAGGRTE